MLQAQQTLSMWRCSSCGRRRRLSWPTLVLNQPCRCSTCQSCCRALMASQSCTTLRSVECLAHPSSSSLLLGR